MAKAKKHLSPLYSFFPTEIEGFDSLAELALDMRWSWNHAADEIWRRLDEPLWELTRNPWVPPQHGHLGNAGKRHRRARPGNEWKNWRRQDAMPWNRRRMVPADEPHSPLTRVAYFSMEFMLSEPLPIYSGGLGNVAGDQLKAASDLGVPVSRRRASLPARIFRQVIDKDGIQQALFVLTIRAASSCALARVRTVNGSGWSSSLPGYSVWLRAWQVQVGRVMLYLLDSNDAAKLPERRGITSELYGGGTEMRLNQELVLGLGGWRLLEALGIRPEVCHLNEGHAAFAVLDRARAFMEETKRPFDVALAATRAGNLFTTHTPVAAGFDRFEPSLIRQYLGGMRKTGSVFRSSISVTRKENPDDETRAVRYGLPCSSGERSGKRGEQAPRGGEPENLHRLFPRWPVR